MGLRRLCLGDGNAVCLAMANLAPVAAALGACVVMLGKVEDDVVPGKRILFHIAQCYLTEITACMGHCLEGDAAALRKIHERPVRLQAAQEAATHLKHCAALFGNDFMQWTDRLESEDQSTFRMLVAGVRAVCDHSLINQQDPVLTVYSDMAAAMLERLAS
eukprot:s2927_g6.t1